MTREEIRQEAEERVNRYTPYHTGSFIQGYMAGAEPREKQIAELEEENNKLLDVINNQDVKIADLEKQIEKMKCCEICAYGSNDFGVCYSNKPCKNKNQWKLTNWVKVR